VWVTRLAILDREAIVSCPYIPLRYQFHFLLPLLSSGAYSRCRAIIQGTFPPLCPDTHRVCFPFVLCRTVPEIFFSLDLSLPNQSMQNHIHELAKSLPVPQPAPRKQNTACDACRLADQCILCPAFLIHVVRSRKVKCNRIPGQDKVLHISYVSQPSTYHFWASYSAKSVLTPAMFTILTCAAALHVQELSMHVRTT